MQEPLQQRAAAYVRPMRGTAAPKKKELTPNRRKPFGTRGGREESNLLTLKSGKMHITVNKMLISVTKRHNLDIKQMLCRVLIQTIGQRHLTHLKPRTDG